VRAKINGADLSLNEERDVAVSLGGVMCSCPIPKPLGPAGTCPDCGMEGPFYRQALEYAKETRKARMDENYAITDGYVPVDWHQAFRTRRSEPDWLFPPILEASTLNVLYGLPGVGKALALDTPLPTPSGWTTMGEVQVGDDLIDANGKPTRVVAVTGIMQNRPCYEVKFDDGTVITADADHQWLVETRASRMSAAEQRKYKHNTPSRSQQHKRRMPEVLTTKEMAGTFRCGSDNRSNYSVPATGAFQFPDAPLPIDPYVLGVWLGDGHKNAASVTTADQEILDNLASRGVDTKLLKGDSSGAASTYAMILSTIPESIKLGAECAKCGYHWKGRAGRFPRYGTKANLCRKCRADCTSRGVLRGLDVLYNKHIPEIYLRASEWQRRELLAGLLDTDGWAESNGSIGLAFTCKRLAEGARELIFSLGYRCGWSEQRVKGKTEESSVSYRMTFASRHNHVFRLSRKDVAHRERLRSRSSGRSNRRYIVDVREVSSVPVRCVQVDNPDHLYLASRSMIPTHNSLLVLDLVLEILREGRNVAIFDEENRVDEVVERLTKFGVTDPGELGGLSWYSFPQLPPLDTPAGGEHLVAVADRDKPALIVLDTTTRMIEGDENSASTWLQLYRCSLAPLKQRGIAVLRLDHQGKDPSKGQRGSSAKDGDVDTIWRLKFQDGGYLALEREKSRSGHGEDWLLVERLNDPLRHAFKELAHMPITPKIEQWADNFDRWGIPRDAGRPTLRAAIQEKTLHDEGISTTLLAMVARYRKGLDSPSQPEYSPLQ